MNCRDDYYIKELEDKIITLKQDSETQRLFSVAKLEQLGEILEQASKEIDKVIISCKAPHDFIARIEELKRRAG